MEKNIDSIKKVQKAEREAKNLIDDMISKKQKMLVDANTEAQKIVNSAESNSVTIKKKMLDDAEKEAEKIAKENAKNTEQAKKKLLKLKLSKKQIENIADKVAKELAN